MKISRNDPCPCGSGKKVKRCHGQEDSIFSRPFKRLRPKGHILTSDELPSMRRACKLAARILDEVCSRVKPGTSTDEINRWVHEMTLDAGAYPSPLNYPKGQTDPRNPRITPGAFPRSVCTSINDVVCHGIPKAGEVLRDGDIVNIDVTCTLDGFYGDTSRTIYVGEPTERARRLVECARECLRLGIEAVRPGDRLIRIGEAIHGYASKLGYGVVRDFTGHGIGKVFHTDPQVCHYPNPDMDCDLVMGMTFTIEPMINEGTWRTRIDTEDKWTVYTLDGKLSAQFEHTVLVTQFGAEILTVV